MYSIPKVSRGNVYLRLTTCKTNERYILLHNKMMVKWIYRTVRYLACLSSEEPLCTICQMGIVWASVLPLWYVLLEKKDHHPSRIPKDSRIMSRDSGSHLQVFRKLWMYWQLIRGLDRRPEPLISLLWYCSVLKWGGGLEQRHSFLPQPLTRKIWNFVISMVIKSNPSELDDAPLPPVRQKSFLEKSVQI